MATTFKDNHATMLKNSVGGMYSMAEFPDYEDAARTFDSLPLYSAVDAKPSVEQYGGKYDSRVDNLYNTLNNFGQNYNYNTDPAYQAYRKEYLRNGQRATQDTMASAAAMTGGRPSSYAATAAAQAGNNYAAQLSDKVPELYNQAYNRYMQQFQNAQSMQQNDYNRFSQERQFGYNANQDWIKNMMNLHQMDYNIYDAERNFMAEQRQRMIQNTQAQRAQDWNMWLQRVNAALSVGDFTMLREMGFNPTALYAYGIYG